MYTEFYKCATKPLGLATYCKQWKSKDPKTIFGKRFSYIISSAIKSNNNNCLLFTGCDANFLKLWFEFKFDENMNWDNYSSYFQIDHVNLRSLFNIEDDNDRRIMNY